MLNKLVSFIERHLTPGDASSPHLSSDQKRLAFAALLIEVAIADQDFSPAESDALAESLRQQFSLSSDILKQLISAAREETKDAVSLHQFTRLVNEHCEPEEKLALITAMWEMAYADERLDMHEEHVIRKVADLIYIPHAMFTKTKHNVKTHRG